MHFSTVDGRISKWINELLKLSLDSSINIRVDIFYKKCNESDAAGSVKGHVDSSWLIGFVGSASIAA